MNLQRECLCFCDVLVLEFGSLLRKRLDNVVVELEALSQRDCPFGNIVTYPLILNPGHSRLCPLISKKTQCINIYPIFFLIFFATTFFVQQCKCSLKHVNLP